LPSVRKASWSRFPNPSNLPPFSTAEEGARPKLLSILFYWKLWDMLLIPNLVLEQPEMPA